MTTTKPILEVVRLWKERAATAEALADSRGAHIVRLCAEELEEALKAAGDTVLTLPQAAAQSGYSAEHLRRLVRQEKIPNAGRKNAPRIRQADLPRKAGDLTEHQPTLQLFTATPSQIARRIAAEGR
jgi:hypothetical protein